jgi:hypothetical protein
MSRSGRSRSRLKERICPRAGSPAGCAEIRWLATSRCPRGDEPSVNPPRKEMEM